MTTRKSMVVSYEKSPNDVEEEIEDVASIEFGDSETKNDQLLSKSSKKANSKNVKTSGFLTLSCLLLLAWTVYTLHEIFLKSMNSKNEAKDENTKIKHTTIDWYSHPDCGKVICTGHCKTRVRKLVGGSVANLGDWPWMAEITIRKKFTCGGVLLNNHYVITAAHCLYRKGKKIDEIEVQIILGSHHRNLPQDQQQTFAVCKVDIHEHYNPLTLENDIALIKLKHPAKFSPYILPVCIPKYVTNQSGVLAGWGKYKPNGPFSPSLKQVEMPMVDLNRCKNHNNEIYRRVKVYNDMHLCIGRGKTSDKYACAGDSGGGFFQKRFDRWFVQGIVSWNDPSCNASMHDSFTVLTDVSHYANWIGSNMDI